MNAIKKEDKIYVAGHAGLVGSAVVRQLLRQGYQNILTAPHSMLELTDQAAVNAFFKRNRPDVVVMCAAKVGGIAANNAYPADFIAINLMIETNTIDAAWRFGARKFVMMGSCCLYPKEPVYQPISEDLLTGALEPTNQWYAVAKIAGMKMCEAYRLQHGFNAVSVMPANLYGPGDNFDLAGSHVIPALIRKFHEATIKSAPQAEIWGTGSPRREFIYVDDLADAVVFVMENYNDHEPINIGTGDDISIGDLATKVSKITGYTGQVLRDLSRPDGVMRRIIDSSKLRKLGWTPKISLDAGLALTYQWFLNNSYRIGATTEGQSSKAT
jgi:GDP-L-fucose synthase